MNFALKNAFTLFYSGVNVHNKDNFPSQHTSALITPICAKILTCIIYHWGFMNRLCDDTSPKQ